MDATICLTYSGEMVKTFSGPDAVMRHETVPRGDDLIYEKMALHPLGTHTFPFAYRIGVPWLVHILPFSHHRCCRSAASMVGERHQHTSVDKSMLLLQSRLDSNPRLTPPIAKRNQFDSERLHKLRPLKDSF